MNKYEEAFQRWKRYNFNPTDLPDDADECGRILDEMKHDYNVVQEGLKKAEVFDLVFSGYVEERGCPGQCKDCDTDDYCPFTIVRGVERMVENHTCHGTVRELNSKYDSEADVMYINFYTPPREAEFAKTRGDFIFRYVGDELIGITIFPFRRSGERVENE